MIVLRTGGSAAFAWVLARARLLSNLHLPCFCRTDHLGNRSIVHSLALLKDKKKPLHQTPFRPSPSVVPRSSSLRGGGTSICERCEKPLMDFTAFRASSIPTRSLCRACQYQDPNPWQDSVMMSAEESVAGVRGGVHAGMHVTMRIEQKNLCRSTVPTRSLGCRDSRGMEPSYARGLARCGVLGGGLAKRKFCCTLHHRTITKKHGSTTDLWTQMAP